MALEWALKPVSDDAPCGPDLDKSDDADFVDYYFDALGRLPERYVIPGMTVRQGDKDVQTPDRVFDPKTVELNVTVP